jgi:hypothetical protein
MRVGPAVDAVTAVNIDTDITVVMFFVSVAACATRVSYAWSWNVDANSTNTTFDTLTAISIGANYGHVKFRLSTVTGTTRTAVP